MFKKGKVQEVEFGDYGNFASLIPLSVKPWTYDNDKNLSLDLILQLNIILSQKMLKSNGKYLVDTQFMLFEDEVTKRLVDLLDDPDANLSKEINEMIHDPDLQKRGLVKDWDYKELH